eukprot:SAG11_NODE_2093_length_3834_cov_2.402945_7_plen_198_part_00
MRSSQSQDTTRTFDATTTAIVAPRYHACPTVQHSIDRNPLLVVTSSGAADCCVEAVVRRACPPVSVRAISLRSHASFLEKKGRCCCGAHPLMSGKPRSTSPWTPVLSGVCSSVSVAPYLEAANDMYLADSSAQICRELGHCGRRQKPIGKDAFSYTRCRVICTFLSCVLPAGATVLFLTKTNGTSFLRNYLGADARR